MGRVTKARRVCAMPLYARFAPQPDEAKAPVRMEIEDYECIRLMDYLGMTQEECAVQMGVARTTVQGIYTRARRRLAGALVEGRPLQIAGGNFELCPQQGHGCGQSRCLPQPHTAGGASMDVPPDLSATKGRILMRLAIPYDNGQVFQHFGRSEQFKIYDIQDGKVLNEQVVGTGGTGHGALAGLLANGGVDTLICGGIGGGAINALAQAGITVYAGAQGSCNACVEALIAGTLAQNGEATCGCHGHDHEHAQEHGNSCSCHGHHEHEGHEGCGCH